VSKTGHFTFDNTATLANVDRFWKFFHCWISKETVYLSMIKTFNLPQLLLHYTLINPKIQT